MEESWIRGRSGYDLDACTARVVQADCPVQLARKGM
jgi:hypothetical protein